MSERETRDGAPTRAPEGRNAAEWITLGVSFLVVTLMVGTALYEHFAREEPPGSWILVEIDVARAVHRGDLFYVPFTVRNAGTAPAEDVAVVFAIKDGETVLEESTTTIPFLANSGSADGQLVTAYDPATYAIEARPATLLAP